MRRIHPELSTSPLLLNQTERFMTTIASQSGVHNVELWARLLDTPAADVVTVTLSYLTVEYVRRGISSRVPGASRRRVFYRLQTGTPGDLRDRPAVAPAKLCLP